ncbi:MAG TPA: DUF2069 domain-containing protein [Dokdonella sp.]|uniref:DUF2069 domain-containing protein n=1 Tax=Dokdonella sp. TaxID=2291710 RepID=UPI0025C158D5|nr:DUF2069 domain-containing protein [Dokdonella sp.]MBX3691957.1 DUF2069 domain-containing protein [Dokdonella sp.]MCW5568720.1 DUF2069 domain-containing protein [Dokdonella sp.]HNR91992.1 DUF2069 domain-containing protein [Dokdonella sp.]
MRLTTIGFGAWTGLVVLQPLWYLWAAPPANGLGWLALALTLPPLLLPLLAARRGARRMLLWTGIIALGYFSHGIVVAWTNPVARVPALVEVALCVGLIFTLGAIARAGRRKPAASA